MNAPRVMIVEDERIVALNLCRTLNRLGYDASTVVANGTDALRSIEELRPDVVLMDIHIDGEIDGIETVARIPDNLMLPVIYLTAYSEDATLNRARDTKPYGYLVKPFSERELHATITMALERWKSDLAVRQSEERLRLALAAAELGSWEVDPETGKIYCKSYEDQASDDNQHLVADSFRDFLSGVAVEDRRLVEDSFATVTARGDLCEVEFRRPDTSGNTKWYRVIGRTFIEGSDRRKRLLGVVRDITAIKLSAEEHRRSEQNYRDLISTIRGIVWEADLNRNEVTYVSDSVESILGYSAVEWMTTPHFWESHLHPDDRASAVAMYRTATEVGVSYDSTYRMLDSRGNTIWIHEVVAIIGKSGGNALVRGLMVDISTLKNTEAEVIEATRQLAESKGRLATILDTAAVGIITVDENLSIISFNREAERIFGYRAAEILERPLDLLIPAPVISRHRELAQEFMVAADDRRAMGNWREISGRASDGRDLPLSVIISRVEIDGRVTMTAIIRDMTDVRRAEVELQRLLEDRERALERAEEANRAKSSFLAVMSHELRTPLNAIIGFSEIMERELFGPLANGAYRQYATDIHQSGALLLSHVNSILDLSRIESGKYDMKLGPVTLGEAWIPAARTLSVNAEARGVELVALEPLDKPVFTADVKAVLDILVNLVSNSIKFTPAGGRIEIGTIDEGDEIAVFVRDNGRGIPEDKLADVIKPFVQVSDALARDTGGVGLGLAICKSLTEAMRGRLTIESQVGRGTTVSIHLPRWKEERMRVR